MVPVHRSQHIKMSIVTGASKSVIIATSVKQITQKTISLQKTQQKELFMRLVRCF